MNTISAQELKSWIESGKDFQLIDCREPHEFEESNINGELIPMNTILDNVDKIRKDVDVVIHCRSGARSGNVIQWLNQNEGFTNLLNLEGGILAYNQL